MKNKLKSLVSKGCAMAMVAAGSMTTALATNPWSSATSKISSLVGNLETALKSIVVPIAGCALVLCFIMMLVSQNQKKVEQYRTWVITIIICIVAIYAVPFIINLAQQIGQSF